MILVAHIFEPVFGQLRAKRSLTEPNFSEGVDTFFDPDFVQDFEHNFSDLRYISLPEKAKRDLNKNEHFGRVKSEDSDCKNGGCGTNKKHTVKVNTKRDSSDIEKDINELYNLIQLQESNRKFRNSKRRKRTHILYPSSNQIKFVKPHSFLKHRLIPSVIKPEYTQPNKLGLILPSLKNNRHSRQQQQHLRRSRLASLNTEDGHAGSNQKRADIVIDRYTTYNPCVYMPTTKHHTTHHHKKHPHKKPPDHHGHVKGHHEVVLKKQKHTTHTPHIITETTTTPSTTTASSTTAPSITTTECYNMDELFKKMETTTICYNPADLIKTSVAPNSNALDLPESVNSSPHAILKRSSKHHSNTPMIRNASPNKQFGNKHFINYLRHKRNLLPNHELNSDENSRKRRIPHNNNLKRENSHFLIQSQNSL